MNPIRNWRTTVWILLRVPTTLDLESTTGSQAELLDLVLHAHGFRRSCWGRMTSDPELTMLFTSWWARNHYEAFARSSTGQAFFNAIATIHPMNTASAITPFVVTVHSGSISRLVLYPHAEIRAVFFPNNLSDGSAKEIQYLHGPQHSCGFFSMEVYEALCAYHHSPMIGWMAEFVPWTTDMNPFPGKATAPPVKKNGEVVEASAPACKVLFILMSWRNEERERKFKELGLRQTVGPFVPTMENWDRELRDAGALGWKEFYVDFGKIRR